MLRRFGWESTDQLRRVEEAELVTATGLGETCPLFASKRWKERTIGSRKGQGLPTVGRIGDQADPRLHVLLASLDVRRTHLSCGVDRGTLGRG